MKTQTELAEHFDRSRGHLRAVAFRMLGSVDEADDAIQETWLRADRAAGEEILNPTGWLTTILGRVCLDMLRSRRRRGEDFTDMSDLEAVLADHRATDPEDEAVMADSVGLALLVVLDTLSPAERVAFVLHDLFAVPFAQVAEIVERSPVTTKKLASRARQRVHGTPAVPAVDLARQREVVEAFLAASRTGDLQGLLTVLAPDVVRRVSPAALRPELRGARQVAEETRTNMARARFARPALVDGIVGAVVAPAGRLLLVLRLTVAGDRITEIDVITDPAAVTLAVLDIPET
jgi:RNA polymerase sigma-70 factor (ECF subfamily)